MSHAKYSPSNSARWLHCTTSVNLPKKEEKQSSYANRGTALHSAAEDLLTGKELKKEYDGYTPTAEDMELTVEPYVNYVKNIDADYFFYEKKVEITPECYGTADVIAYKVKTKTLHVIDLKAGKGIFVSVNDNTQLQIYAIGAVVLLEKIQFDVEKIVLHIVQPGIDNICSVEVDIKILSALYRDIQKAIKDVNAGTTNYAPSTAACKWCQHKTSCPALNTIAVQVAKKDFEGLELSDKLKMVPALKLFIKAVEEESLERLNQNKDLPGFKLIRSRGRKVWGQETIALTLLEKAGIPQSKLFSPGKILTPTQMVKLAKTENIDIDLSLYIEMQQGAPKVVLESAKGDPINKVADAINDFS